VAETARVVVNFQVKEGGGRPEAGPIVVVQDEADPRSWLEAPGDGPEFDFDPVLFSGFQ
jgi:hypothetical protein